MADRAATVQILPPTTEAAAAFGREKADIRFKQADLRQHRQRLVDRGFRQPRLRDSLRREIQTIDQELSRSERCRRIWGYEDDHGNRWYFDRYAGDRVIRWIEENCVLTKGRWRGKPFKLQRWQRKIIRQIFGWKNEAGFRRFQEVWLELPRKNGKSELAAAIGLYLLIGDREGGAEIYCIAGNEKQARITFERASMMVRHSRTLFEHLEPLKRRISHLASDSELTALGKDNQHGLNPHGVIGDEVHEWKGRDQYEAMDTADGARDQPLRLFITTAGHDLETLCGELHRIAKQVAARKLYRPDLYARIYTIPEGADWKDERSWYLANPGLKHGAPTIQSFRTAFRKCLGRPAQENGFKRLRLNIWTDQISAWITKEQWDACRNTEIDWSLLERESCWAGIDLAKVHDLSALALLFPPDNPVLPGKWLLKSFFWCPEGDIEAKEGEDEAPYRKWAEDGYIRPTPGDTVDFDRVESDLIQILDTYDVLGLGYDEYKAQQVIQHLRAHETDFYPTGPDCLVVPQTLRVMAPPTAEIERMVIAGELVHDGNPVMDWCIGNTVVWHDSNGNYRPHKAKSKKRIDGAVAAINARVLTMMEDEDDESVYTERGALVI